MIITVCVDFQLPIAQSLRLLARSLLSSLMYLFLKSHHQHSTLSLLRNITLFIVDCISHSRYPFLCTPLFFIDLPLCAVFNTILIIAYILYSLHDISFSNLEKCSMQFRLCVILPYFLAIKFQS